MKLYMAVTNDRYQLPLGVSEDPGELAKMLGVKRQTILCDLCPSRKHRSKEKKRDYKVVRIRMEEEP